MVSLESIKNYMQGLNQKEIIRILLAYFVVCILIISFLVYSHVNALVEIEQKTKILNKARQKVQLILTEYDHIKSKKSEVDALLEKDKNFYIQKYCQDTLASLKLTNQSPLSLESQTWPNGYREESVQINLAQITMKQVCEFLQALQSNHLVFVKNLDMVKATDKKISVNMVVATLKPVEEKTSSTK